MTITYAQTSSTTQTANIVAYNASTRTAILDAPVTVSLGVNDYLAGSITSHYSISGQATSIASAINAGAGLPALSSDEAGNFVGIFNVPSSTFQTGSRVFRLDNRTVMSDSGTATTYAEATFTASGLSTTSQASDFAPSVDASAQTFTQVNQQPNQVISTIVTNSAIDPIAQTFQISQANYPNGAFLNDVKLFFATVPTTNVPITVSIVPTLNGYPNGQALSYSTVTLMTNQVNTSTSPHYLDATTYTTFQFQAPVYIQPGVLYAILIKSSSPDYTLYYAQQNQLAIPSSAKAHPTDANPTNPTKIGTAPYVGALFESQNSQTWTADLTKDLMFVIDQCLFQTSTASIPFVTPARLPYRKLATKDILHKISPFSVTNITGNYASNTTIDAFNVSTTDFSPTGTNINYSYSATLASGLQTPYALVTPGSLGSPAPKNIMLNDGQGERQLYTTSNNSFTLAAQISSSDPNVSPIISDDGVSLYAIRYVVNNMGLGNNVINVVTGGSGYNVQTATVTISSPDLPGGSAPTLGFTSNATGSITSVYALTAGSGYITTPTITIYDPTSRSGNANAVISVSGETGSSGGNGIAKYVTKKVVLAPGNDSGDLRVYLTAYQPLGTGIYVYYKILSSQDTSAFESIGWQLMTCTNNYTAFSADPTNLIEYEYAPGVYNSNRANNFISYNNPNGQTYSSFIQFAIKVVMATNDNTNVPTVTSLRAIALPPGTGM